jgi:ABC-type lipoprotein release transport system permease subunit
MIKYAKRQVYSTSTLTSFPVVESITAQIAPHRQQATCRPDYCPSTSNKAINARALRLLAQTGSLLIALVVSQLAAIWPARRAAGICIIEAIPSE